MKVPVSLPQYVAIVRETKFRVNSYPRANKREIPSIHPRLSVVIKSTLHNPCTKSINGRSTMKIKVSYAYSDSNIESDTTSPLVVRICTK